MNKVIIWARPDGGVSITYPAPLKQDGETEKQYLDRVALRFIISDPRHAGFIRQPDVDLSAVPTDRTFRNAWKPDLSVDMPKAREIAREHIRQARVPRFAALDAEFIRALEDADLAKQAQIKAQKAILRNASTDPRIANAADAEALKTARDAVIAEMP